jgi:hypothetical protein
MKPAIEEQADERNISLTNNGDSGLKSPLLNTKMPRGGAAR